MSKIRTLIVDDSIVFRTQIRVALSALPTIEVVGTAANGLLALEYLQKHTVDLITLDLEMPEMGGIDFLKALRKQSYPAPKVIVFSTLSKRDAQITLEALSLGANEFSTKPDRNTEDSVDPAEKIRGLLSPKVEALFGNHTFFAETVVEPKSYPKILWDLLNPKLIVIGSSTGGPSALEAIFAEIKGPIKCPILIAQHMPPIFTASLAERLERLSKIPAAEGKQDEPIVANRIYIAPGNFHMSIVGSASAPRIHLDQGPLLNSVRPAVDPLFSSAAHLFGPKCFGLILTGMGKDGLAGTLDLKEKGAGIMIQSRESCVVFGMPGAVFAHGCYDRMGDLKEITETLNKLVH
jgi:two-component system chemotaxis response regulator CheB